MLTYNRLVRMGLDLAAEDAYFIAWVNGSHYEEPAQGRAQDCADVSSLAVQVAYEVMVLESL